MDVATVETEHWPGFEDIQSRVKGTKKQLAMCPQNTNDKPAFTAHGELIDLRVYSSLSLSSFRESNSDLDLSS